MFDNLEMLDEAGLLATMGDSLRAERAACAHRIIAAGLFATGREERALAQSGLWCVDDLDVAAAEVGAHLGISRYRAGTDISYGQLLLTRFPAVAARFLAGDIDLKVIAAIDARTTLLTDPEHVARLDDLLAASAPNWNALSRKRLTEVIDWMVVELDPDARRHARERDEDRRVDITPDQHGMADLTGRLPAVGAATLDKRLDAMAADVCPDDPRTRDHRRADALVALSEGTTTLTCQCGTKTCTAADGSDAAAPTQVVIHVIAERATLDGEGTTPGYLPGYGPIPADTVRDVAGTTVVKVKPLVIPPPDAEPEPRYRPSAALAEFINLRDLGCRWPGCTVPAHRCDIDREHRGASPPVAV